MTTNTVPVSSSLPDRQTCDGLARIMQLIDDVQRRMKDEFGMQEVRIENSTNIFVSKDYNQHSRVLIIVPYRQAGVWSHSICLNGDDEAGSMFGYIRKAIDEDYGIVIMNPAAAKNDSKVHHVETVWTQIIAPLMTSNLFIVAYSRGCELVQDLLNFDRGQGIVQDRVRAMALVEPSHHVSADDTYFARKMLAQRGMVWLLSSQVVAGQKMPAGFEKKFGCVCVSAGPVPAVVSGSSGAWALQQVMQCVFGSFAARCGRACGITTKPESRLVDCGICRRKLRLLNRKITCAWCEVRMCSKCTTQMYIKTYGVDHLCLICQSLPCLIDHERLRQRLDRQSILVQPKQNEELSLLDFELIKLIGKGACGRVKLVRKNHGHDEGSLYAMKTIRKKLVMQKGLVEATNAERRIMNHIQHPFITQLCYAFQTDAKLYLLTKYYPGGNLLDQMRHVRRFTPDRVRLYTAEIALALDHLHRHRIMYRDLKLENVLCDRDGHVALTDFGMSKENVGTSAKTFVGTYQLMAPDILSGEPYTNAVDWWALGVMVYEMVEGRTPFNGKDNAAIKQRILRAEIRYSPRFTPPVQDFVSKLLAKDPNERLGIDGIKQHPWFEGLDWDRVYRREQEFTNQSILMQSYAKEYTVEDIVDTYRQTQEVTIDTPASVKSSTEQLFDDFAYNFMDEAQVAP